MATKQGIICIRVYNNESVRRVFRYASQAQVDAWIAYNTQYRPGCGLIVDGKIIQTGYLTVPRLEAWVHLDEKYQTPPYTKDIPFSNNTHE